MELDKLKKNIKKWEKNEKINFNKKILLVNFSKLDIENARKVINELDSKIKSSSVKVYGFDEFNEIISYINS